MNSLVTNTDKRFSDSLDVVNAFGILDLLDVPNSTNPDFKEYGTSDIDVPANHFYPNDQLKATKLHAEWNQFNYYINDHTKQQILNDIRPGKSTITPARWFLMNIARNKAKYLPFFENMIVIAEIALTPPVSNAWPERGASALKLVKSRHRSRLKNDMLQCLLHVKINGPDVLSPDAKTIIKMAADEFLSRKKRKKVGYRSSEGIVGNVVVTGDDIDIEVSVGSNGGADEVGGERDKSNEDINEVNDDEDEEIEAIAHQLKLPDVGDTGSSDDSGIESDEEFDTFEEF